MLFEYLSYHSKLFFVPQLDLTSRVLIQEAICRLAIVCREFFTQQASESDSSYVRRNIATMRVHPFVEARIGRRKQLPRLFNP